MKSSSFEAQSELSNTLQFRELANKLAELGRSIGVEIVPYRDESLPFFRQVPVDHQNFIVRDLKTYLHICEMTQREGASLRNTSNIVWSALKEFKLRPGSDLFTYIPEGNVIEIHNREFVQIFRNFKFYEFCSYSLEELYCNPWTALYSRDEEIEKQLFQVADKMFKGLDRSVQAIDLAHVISEVSSPKKFQIQARIKYIAPLCDEKSDYVSAYIVIEEGRILNREENPALALLDDHPEEASNVVHLRPPELN